MSVILGGSNQVAQAQPGGIISVLECQPHTRSVSREVALGAGHPAPRDIGWFIRTSASGRPVPAAETL